MMFLFPRWDMLVSSLEDTKKQNHLPDLQWTTMIFEDDPRKHVGIFFGKHHRQRLEGPDMPAMTSAVEYCGVLRTWTSEWYCGCAVAKNVK